MIVFPDEELAEIADKEAVTNDIILKTSGRKPVVSPVQKRILIGCLLIFFSAPILWTADWILGKRHARKITKMPFKTGLGACLSRIYALLSILLAILFYGALLRAPFLAYWPDLPGWIDGISVTENLFLALPTLLALASIGLTIITIWVWLKKYWSLFERLHYIWLAVSMLGYIALLSHWHLIGFSYYWNYLIR
jgi:hypothetical protein